MDTTMFLTQFWGWLLVIMGLLLFFQKNAYFGRLFDLVENKEFTLLSGYLALILGLATVILHNVWTANAGLIITIFGWVTLAKGIIRIGFPTFTRHAIRAFRHSYVFLRLCLVLMVFFGAWLLAA